MNDIVDLEPDEGQRAVGRPKKKTRDKMSFVKDAHPLDKPIKQSNKKIEDVMEALANLALDAKVEPSVRAKAGADYVKAHISMVESRAKQQMAELIAEYRIAGRSGTFVAEEDDTPELSFGEIAEEFRGVQNVEYKQLDKE